MPFHATVLYPNEDDIKFDMSYYLSTHMPLVMERFGKYGLKGYQVTDYKPGADGAKPPFCTGCTLIWDSPEDMQSAMSAGDDAGVVFGDIPNFCNKQPVLMAGSVVASK
ncbi:hypothetical protein LTR67_006539 [Exophiala xenobiotica]|jgi:uncharacterized protein (TIGR02118 family)